MDIQTDRASRPAIPLRGHLPALDGLRGVAILAVMMFHWTVLPRSNLIDDVFWRVGKSGWIGVDLFFVLSGFLITRILLSTKEGPGYFRNFYARRALRIFPLYYAYLAVVAIVLPLLLPADGDVRAYAADAGWHVVYLSNVLQALRGEGTVNGHLWSLAVEEQFYLLWPLAVFMLSVRRLAAVSIALILGAFLFRLGLLLNLGHERALPALALLPARIDTLVIGGLLAIFATRPGTYARLRIAAPGLLTFAGTALLGIVVLTTGFLNLRAIPMALFGLPLLAIFFASLLFLAVTAPSDSRLARFCGSRLLTTIGKYSYCMYVIHIIVGDALGRVLEELPVITIAGSMLPAQVMAITAASAATFVLSWVSWQVWERHWLRLKTRFETRSSPAATGRPAVAVMD